MADENGDHAADSLPELSFTIPGPWASLGALMDDLRRAAPQWELGEHALIDTRSGRRFFCDGGPTDADLGPLFLGDPQSRLTEKERDALRSHCSKIRLAGVGGSQAAAKACMDAVAALIEAGGCGVLVESACLTHGPLDWLDLAADTDSGGVYWGFVNLIGSRELFSVGMHALGLRDAEMPDVSIDRREAGMRLHEFLGYTYMSGITVVDGDPLGGEEGPLYRVRHVACHRFQPGTAPYNPYGVWRLESFEE
jgi:hypothetical protein